MQIINFKSNDLYIKDFHITAGESWCILGANSSGIDTFFKILSGESPTMEVTLPEKPAIISFARLQKIFEDELKKDDTNFLDRIDPGTPARDFLRNPEQHKQLIEALNLEGCLDKGFRQLSTGESRKLMLLSTISRNPGTLLIENPYDGLDTTSCRELNHSLQTLHQIGRQIIITVNNDTDVPSWCSHLAVLHDGHIILQGKIGDILPKLPDIKQRNTTFFPEIDNNAKPHDTGNTTIISLKDGFASYGSQEIFLHLNLTVMCGQHTLITGPNGSGKSTLLQIITGDNQKCYSNNLRIFGKQRGTGESIWELKKQMAIVSPDLHRNHYIPGSALQVVLSGFFDSIGVYRRFSEKQRHDAVGWLKMIGLKNKVQTPFRQLSFAEQRLCLIARALIKQPQLLVLDEPTQGLDQESRNNLLDFLENIAHRKLSTILYASHRSDEFRSFFQQHIDLSTYNSSQH